MRIKLHWQILIALALAALTGWGIQADVVTGGFASGVLGVSDFLGRMFLNSLQMIVVPLIVASIVCGAMGLGQDKNFGRLGLKTFAYYSVTGLLAITTGLLLVNLIQPGRVSPETAQLILAQTGQGTAEFAAQATESGGSDLLEIFIRMIPPNVIDAAANNGQLLGVIFFSLLFGFFISRLPDDLRETQSSFWSGAMSVMTKIADLIIYFAPIGVFALVTPVVANFGVEAFGALAKFFLTVMAGLAIHAFITLPLALRFIGGISPAKHYRVHSPALLTAFSTASSAATLPVTMESAEKGAGVSNRIASFTLPLGATVNMDGTALYECVVVIFIAQISGIDLSLTSQFSVLLLALLTSVGVAGIPNASLVAIMVILAAVGLPVGMIGIVLAVDRVLDMSRTAVNVLSDTCGASVIARTEGETLETQV